MPKAILLSIRPEWVAKILNGKKTIEIRKTMPKCDLPIDVYIYCTKDNKGLVWDKNGKGLVNKKLFPYAERCPENNRLLNGKVVAKFTLNKVEEIDLSILEESKNNDICKKSCLSAFEMADYIAYYGGYAWHIDNLEIFDKSKELKEFNIKRKYTCSKSGCPYFATDKCRYASECLYEKPLTKAPQNLMYIDIN